jgi:hypothetical protein
MKSARSIHTLKPSRFSFTESGFGLKVASRSMTSNIEYMKKPEAV